MEIYRYLIDDFLIEYCRSMKSTDFTVKTENVARNKQGKRVYPSDNLTRKLIKRLELHFQSIFNISRISENDSDLVDSILRILRRTGCFRDVKINE